MVGNSEWTPELSRRWDQGIIRYPDPAVEVLDPRFLAYRIGNAAVRAPVYRNAMGRGPGLVWRLQIPGLQRYTKQSDAALLRGN